MDSKQIATSIAGFSTRFFNELDKNKSVVSSPLSAEVLLGLLALGSNGQTQTELLTALGLKDPESVRSAFSSVTKSVTGVKGVTLNIANKVYVKEGNYELVPKLKDDAVKVFDASFEKANFNDGAVVANNINKWVEGKTNNKIKDLIKADDLNESTRLVLLNAIYFKGNWKKQFNPNMTHDLPFHVNNKTTVNIPFMHKEDNFKYGESETLQAQILGMDYVGEDTSMVIVLPNDVEGLNGVISKLAKGHDLIGELDKLHSLKVDVYLPKFKIETEIDLNSVLPKIGIKSIFDPSNTGLTNILTNNEPLFVSKAIQKAFIEVNEEGAEAAAATGMVMMLRCMPMPSPRFTANKPFLYLLVGPNRTPLFMGTFFGDN